MSQVFETKCEVCGKEFKGSRAAGALALHMYKSHGQVEEENDNDKNANWRMLDPKDPKERMAIDKGFTMISNYPGKGKSEQTLK